ncbi:TonB-dependent siderophore receptor [Leptolyngbyaceae cyanobacterium UHCC 1019]
MRVEQDSVQLGLAMALMGGLVGGVATNVGADETDGGKVSASSVTKSVANISRVRDLKQQTQPATTVKQWLAQMEAATVQVTGVKLERTETGLDIVLETAEGKSLTIDATQFRSEGNSLIAEIPNATLTLPQGQAFVADNPTADIATVQVEQRSGNIRVSVAGNNALPKTEVTLKTGGLAYSLNPEGDEADEEIVVTGQQNRYRVPNATTATKTDTPLRDIPQSIQVVPQQILQDQKAVRLEDALRNVTGATQTNSGKFVNSGFALRGFDINEFGDFGTILRDGLQDPLGTTMLDLSIVDRIEVLKGPSSVLFGSGAPGGSVNIITKKPLPEPRYEISAAAGNFDTYRGSIDLTGPLNESKTVLYRLIASYRSEGSSIRFTENKNITIAPSLSWRIGEQTNLRFSAEYRNLDSLSWAGQPAIGTTLPSPFGRVPRDLNISDSNSNIDASGIRLGVNLEHQFSQDWSLKSSLGYRTYREIRDGASFPRRLLADGRTLERQYQLSFIDNDVYSFATDIVGNFQTGSIKHQLVFGTSYSVYQLFRDKRDGGLLADLDIFNPVYGQPPRTPLGSLFRFNSSAESNSLGFYLQDQIKFSDNFKMLAGVRFDTFNQTDINKLTSTSTNQSGQAFSPRLGIVYQPIQPISLYASYSESFVPTIGRTFDGTPFEPSKGRQYEIGVKADLSETLSATLAFYDLTRTNVETEDPVNASFSVQTGKQQSQGIELTLTGEILPGLNLYSGYAYTNATIAQDNSLPAGNRLNNIPEHSFNLWANYEFQKGGLKGWGLGLGLFYVGERQGDLANSFQLPGYLRTDAAVFYRNKSFEAQINIQNLFDIDYYSASFGRLRNYRGEPFTIRGSVSWTF